MRVLGIDPGLAITGYGVLDTDEAGEPHVVTYGAIRTPASQPLPARLVSVYDRISQVLAACQPHVVAVERLFFGRNVSTALLVGQARGVVLLCTARSGIPIVEYKPAEVKQAVTGYGRADKQQMQLMVRTLLGLPEVPRPDDVADALAVALCHVYSARFDSLTRVQEDSA